VSGFRPGEVRIAAFLDGGIVRRVAITVDRPLSLAAAMIGRPVAAVAEAMAAVHGLCGQSHAAAVHAAAAAALGIPLARAELARRTVCLAAERLCEHLRTLFLAAGATSDIIALRIAIDIGQRTARTGTLSP
jgi:uptake hydrogenase large subunit